MSADTRTGSPSNRWRSLYESAVIELDLRKMVSKIAEAECAIIERLPNAPDEEKEALNNALTLLGDLRKLAAEQRNQCKPD